jgi:hypothetical protein
MSHWPYIIAAYVLTIGGMAGLALVSWLRMRKAELQAASFAKPLVPSEVEGRMTGSELRPSTTLGTSGNGLANPS